MQLSASETPDIASEKIKDMYEKDFLLTFHFKKEKRFC